MTAFGTSLKAFTRPADTTQYAIGDLVANSTTAGSVVPLVFTFPELGNRRTGRIKKARLQKSSNAATAANFRLHLFSGQPTVTNGDNGALVVTAANLDAYLADISIDMTTGASLIAGANIMTEFSAAVDFNFRAQTQAIYGLLEALATYTPASAEVFTIALAAEFG